MAGALRLERGEGGRLDGEARAHNVERVGEGDGGDAGKATADEAAYGVRVQVGAGCVFEELRAGSRFSA